MFVCIFTVNLGIHVDEPQPSIPPEKPVTDYSEEAEEYEKKLIQVNFIGKSKITTVFIYLFDLK